MNQEVLVQSPVISILCDNVRAAKVLNHLGSKANLFCRMYIDDGVHYDT